MYLHLGNGVGVRKGEVLGVFDLDNSSSSPVTRRYLASAEKEGAVVNAADSELPKSFVVCCGAKGQRVYLSQLNSSTLLKRSQSGELE